MGAAQNLRPGVWRPGQSGNPAGKPSLPAELRAIKALSRDEVARIVAKYGRLTCNELAELVREGPGNIPAMDAAIIRILQEAITKGDFARLEFLLQRSIGKPAELAPVTAEDVVAREIAELSDEELRARVLEAARA